MELGAFSISLAVKDINASKTFYEKLGFDVFGGEIAQKLDHFTNVRDLQKNSKAQGIEIMDETDESTTGPASFMVMDPDGNPLLFDQHV